MANTDPLNIGITCHPTIGGSGVLACALGEELARRGHSVHFISYERPFRLPAHAPRIHFHKVHVSNYGLFKYPDYTLPLSVKIAEVSEHCKLDILHSHYAVPHATAAILANSMLPPDQRPKLVTTLHGTDTTLLGREEGYGPAIRHALEQSDAVTAVSHDLRRQTLELFPIQRPIDVIHNFFTPRSPVRLREQVRRELEVGDRALILHVSNLRSVKRIDLLLHTAALIRPKDSFKLVILAGDSFAPFIPEMKRLGLEDRVIVIEKVQDIEDYLQAADMGLFTSETESFCLSILEAMCFACPSVATRVGGIPEVIEHEKTGLLADFGDAAKLAREVESLINDPARRKQLGQAAQERAKRLFSADAIVPQYEALYRRTLAN